MPGARVIVVRIDSSEVKGTFVEFARIDQPKYYDRFARALGADSELVGLPGPGESAVLTLADSRQVTGEIVGYDLRPRVIEFRDASGAPTGRVVDDTDGAWIGAVLISNQNTNEVERHNLLSLDNLSRPGSPPLASGKVSGWMENHQVAVASAVVVKTHSTITSIPLDQVDDMLQQTDDNMAGMSAGERLIVMAVFAAAFATAIVLLLKDVTIPMP